VNLQSCEDYQELASALADDRLETEDVADLQSHLRECSECRQFMSGIYRVRDFIRGEEVRHALPVPPPHFSAELTRAIRREARHAQSGPAAVSAGRFFSSLGRFSGAAAAAVLLLAAGWSMHKLSGGEVTPVEVSEKAVIEIEEGSMASYVRQHALQAMDATYLGFPEGVELARFEAAGTGLE
jgi:anti-sigma factor RsiW